MKIEKELIQGVLEDSELDSDDKKALFIGWRESLYAKLFSCASDQDMVKYVNDFNKLLDKAIEELNAD